MDSTAPPPEPGRRPHRATIAVTWGRPDRPGDPLNVPPVLASVYRTGGPVGYGRESNPTWAALEEAIGGLEGGTALTFASGMAAVGAVIDTVPDGGRVVAPLDAYIGSRSLLGHLAERGRFTLTAVDVADTGATLAACDGADLLWVESPTNPLLAVADLRALCAGARERGARSVVDNTFATPLLQRPLDLGADVVVHSVTKFLSGHSDLLLGAVVTRDEDLARALLLSRTRSGPIPGAMEAWLALRGVRTLAVRLERAQDNAGELARRLAAHPSVTRVRYPGLPDDPGHARAAAQMDGFGAMLSFECAGGRPAADALCAAVRVVTHATSLGGVETTLERRRRYPGEEHTPESLIRVSVGLEHVDDLWADLDSALEAAGRAVAQ
jgi:cystathionine gamma-synthase